MLSFKTSSNKSDKKAKDTRGNKQAKANVLNERARVLKPIEVAIELKEKSIVLPFSYKPKNGGIGFGCRGCLGTLVARRCVGLELSFAVDWRECVVLAFIGAISQNLSPVQIRFPPICHN